MTREQDSYCPACANGYCVHCYIKTGEWDAPGACLCPCGGTEETVSVSVPDPDLEARLRLAQECGRARAIIRHLIIEAKQAPPNTLERYWIEQAEKFMRDTEPKIVKL